MLRGRIFSPEEADQMVPLVRRIVRDARARRRLLDRALRDGDSGARRDALARGLEECRDELAALGCLLRCDAAGAVECYGYVEGQIVYLCWEPGRGRFDRFRALDAPTNEPQPLLCEG
jgi:hypothetical protein